MSDPYIRVFFYTKAGNTYVYPPTVCPTWDQTVVLDPIVMYGTHEEIETAKDYYDLDEPLEYEESESD